MSLSALIKASIAATLTGTGDLGTPSAPISLTYSKELTDGTAADQAQNIFADTRTLTASASENLDLAGVLANPLSATLTFTCIKVIGIKAAAANTNNVVVGGHATAAFVGPFGDFTDTIAIVPGGMLLLVNPSAAGWPVTATTADLLKVLNGGAGTPVTYDIVLIGEG